MSQGKSDDGDPADSGLVVEGAPTTPGANRKAETQARILGAAMSLFLRRGFERTSVTQIARKAGVSRAAVFWHFGDKATLFQEACHRFLVPLREALGGRLSHLEPRKRLFELFSAYENFVQGNATNVRAFVRWALDSPEQMGVLRQELLALHEAFRNEIEVALAELSGDPRAAGPLADGLISLLDGNLLLAIFGAEGDEERRSQGLRAVSERLLREFGPA